MKFINFKEVNVEIAKNQDNYITLPSYKANDSQGTIIFCAKFNWKERIKLLFTGKLWVSKLTFGNPLQPISLRTDFPFLK